MVCAIGKLLGVSVAKFVFNCKNNKMSFVKCVRSKYLLTVWHVVISLEFEITPNSSTFEARKMQVGASNRGSIHLSEFLA